MTGPLGGPEARRRRDGRRAAARQSETATCMADRLATSLDWKRSSHRLARMVINPLGGAVLSAVGLFFGSIATSATLTAGSGFVACQLWSHPAHPLAVPRRESEPAPSDVSLTRRSVGQEIS
jgi:hypothetical protein